MVDLTRKVVEPKLRDLRQHHTLAGQTVLHHNIEGTDAIGGDDQQRLVTGIQRYIV